MSLEKKNEPKQNDKAAAEKPAAVESEKVKDAKAKSHPIDKQSLKLKIKNERLGK